MRHILVALHAQAQQAKFCHLMWHRVVTTPLQDIAKLTAFAHCSVLHKVILLAAGTAVNGCIAPCASSDLVILCKDLHRLHIQYAMCKLLESAHLQHKQCTKLQCCKQVTFACDHTCKITHSLPKVLLHASNCSNTTMMPTSRARCGLPATRACCTLYILAVYQHQSAG